MAMVEPKPHLFQVEHKVASPHAAPGSEAGDSGWAEEQGIHQAQHADRGRAGPVCRDLRRVLPRVPWAHPLPRSAAL